MSSYFIKLKGTLVVLLSMACTVVVLGAILETRVATVVDRQVTFQKTIGSAERM